MRGYRRLGCWVVPLALLFALAAPPTFAATLTRQAALKTLDDLEARQVISSDVAATQRRYYLQHPERYPVSLGARLRGVVTFANVLWAIASLLLLAAIASLFGLYLVPLLALIPLAAYEALAYAVSLGLMAFSPGEFAALPGCLGLAGSLAWSHVAHGERLRPLYERLGIDAWATCSLLLAIAWGATALWQESAVLGFLAVIALEAFLGLAIAIVPGVYSFGFRSRDALPRAVFASLLLLALYVPLQQGWLDWSGAAVFQPGVLFVGTLVYFLGLLIWSAKWYPRDRPSTYFLLQGITLGSRLAALYGGGVLGIAQFQGIGGTFLVLYLLEKYFEIPWYKHSLA